MNEAKKNTTEDAKQTGVPAPESSPTSVEQTPPTQNAAARRPEFGDHALFADEDRILQATIQVAFTDGKAHLRVIDPSSQIGWFDASLAEFDASRNAWYLPGSDRSKS